MFLKPGTLLSRKYWTKELIVYIGKNDKINYGNSLGFSIFDNDGKYDGRLFGFLYDEDEYPVINNSHQYLKRFKDEY